MIALRQLAPVICALFVAASHAVSSNIHLCGVSDYENSVWVEDWTNNLDASNYIAALPRGVNTINVFVGELALVNGTPSINGYSLDTPGIPAGTGAFPNVAALTHFVQQCKAAGCTVKLSIGGQAGTTFGNSWYCLTSDNISSFAQALVDLCNTTSADGIDFDYELDDTAPATLAGEVAGKFRTIAPQLMTSCCVFGGCDANGPWHVSNTEFLRTAVDGNGWCAIDRIYVMTYYDGCPLSQNEGFMTSWKSWLALQHGFTTSTRISAGVDPNDPTTSLSNESLNAWIVFAQQNGFSTAIWDQQGVNDYVTYDWGTVIHNLYTTTMTPSRRTWWNWFLSIVR